MILAYLLNNYFLGALVIVLFSFFVSYQIFPVIIYLSHIKKLYKLPGDRDFHQFKTPTLGGIGIFFGFMLTIALLGSFLSDHLQISSLLNLTAALLILFFMGIKDDLLALSPSKKLLAQLLAAGIIIFFSDCRITSFTGILGIYELSYFISILFTFFTFVLVINAYNLIDGIDGLAGSLALIISLFFGLYFLINTQFEQALISFSLIGPVAAFLRYNISRNRKIFMGDTGSMVIGFLLAYQSVQFLSINQTPGLLHHLNNAPVIILALLSFPLTDTLRVFMIRIKNGSNPFEADRNHIYHCFLDRGYTPIASTLIISFLSLVVISGAFFLQGLNINLHLILTLILSSLLYLFFTK